MSDTIIKVENLSKRYVLGAQRAEKERYTALRDVMVREARAMGRKAIDLVQGRFERLDKAAQDEFWALKDVSFEVKRGEVLGIIGRNGAGKSTLLKILSRITEPTKGRVELYGRVASLLEVGTGFHPELSGRENIFLNGAILGMTRAEIRRKFDEIVDFAEVERFLDTPVKRYSSGMYVRLAFAVAAHLDPEILIVDEVLAVGDAHFQRKCLGRMENIAAGGRTVLFVTHDLKPIEKLTLRTLVLKDGEVLYLGSTTDALNEYVKSAATSCIYNLRKNEKNSNYEFKYASIQSLRFRRETPLFNSLEALDFDLTFETKQEIPRIRVGLTIYRGDGTPVGTSISNHITNSSAERLNKIYCVVTDLRLAPGSYYMAISIGSGTNKDQIVDFDIVTNVMNFDVMLDLSTDGTVSRWEPGWGPICLNSANICFVETL